MAAGMIDGSDPAAMPPSARSDARAAVRRPAMAPSTLRARGITPTDVTVVDLSQTGVRITADALLAVGDEISIGLSGLGSRRAYVAWARGHDYGCAFERPLEAHEVAQAFTVASVVRLGSPAQASQAARLGTNAELEDLYGAHRLWRLPWDAVLVIGAYLALAAWATWHFA